MTPLPTHHHADDTHWISEQLMQLPSHMRQGACDKYGAAYRAAYDAQGTVAVFAEGPARREANTRLREFVARVTASLGGVVQAPLAQSHIQGGMAHSVAHTGTVAGRGTVQGNGARSAALEMAKGKSKSGGDRLETDVISSPGGRATQGFQQNKSTPPKGTESTPPKGTQSTPPKGTYGTPPKGTLCSLPIAL